MSASSHNCRCARKEPPYTDTDRHPDRQTDRERARCTHNFMTRTAEIDFLVGIDPQIHKERERERERDTTHYFMTLTAEFFVLAGNLNVKPEASRVSLISQLQVCIHSRANENGYTFPKEKGYTFPKTTPRHSSFLV